MSRQHFFLKNKNKKIRRPLKRMEQCGHTLDGLQYQFYLMQAKVKVFDCLKLCGN